MKKYKELSPEDLEYLAFIYYQDMSHNEKLDILTNKFGVVGRTIRKWWVKLDLNDIPSKLPKQLIECKDKEIDSDTDIIFYTSAQNKTIVNNNLLSYLEEYKSFILEKFNKKVQIIIAPSRYRNPTSLLESDKKKSDMWWADEVLPYLFYGKYYFGDCLISTDSRIRPTAKEPLTGYEVLAKDNHLVLPHSKIHFKTLPRFKDNPLRIMSTTGFITRKNYSESKAGETANEHHSYGFVVIEKKKDGTCHIPRNVKVKEDGSFIDMVYEVSDKGVNTINSSKGFVMGDIHASVINLNILNKSWNLIEILKPEKTVLHDVFDGSTCNPHEVKDLYIQKKKIKENRFLIDEEIEHSFDIIKTISDLGTKVYVSLSNHDIFLDRLINDGNWKKDLHNSHNYLKYALIQQTENIEEYGTIYGYLLNKKFEGEVKYLNYNDSLNIEGYECALHGDNGTNGSKGSYKQFSRLNTKMIHGHQHSPVLHNNVTCVGVSCNIDQYYTRKGLSSWAYAHSVIHNNGKNQLLVFGDDHLISDLI